MVVYDGFTARKARWNMTWNLGNPGIALGRLIDGRAAGLKHNPKP